MPPYGTKTIWRRRTDRKRRGADGEYLLCCAADVSVEIRANADWLPIELRFNGDTQALEGQASRRLEVEDTVMMSMVGGGKGEHIASVLHYWA